MTSRRMSDISTTIASAIEEQGAATAGNLAQRPTCGEGHHAGGIEYRRCAARLQRDRIGILASAVVRSVAFARKQSVEARSAELPRDCSSCLSPANATGHFGQSRSICQMRPAKQRDAGSTFIGREEAARLENRHLQ